MLSDAVGESAPTAAGVILAAGSSQRMGRDKTRLPWLDGLLLLPWMVRAFQAAGWEPIVVLGPHNHAHWAEELAGARICLNERPERGKATSLTLGLAAVPASVRHIMISAVDQPRLPELYTRLRSAAEVRGESVIVPDENGHRGHPVVLRSDLKGEFPRLEEGNEGLRGLLDRHLASTYRLSCPPEWMAWDCNTPASHEEALAWFRAQHTA
jgi:molybdenum cofactor cytidylyltransferase